MYKGAYHVPSMLVGHRPTEIEKPVLVKIEYARPNKISAAMSNEGYKPSSIG